MERLAKSYSNSAQLAKYSTFFGAYYTDIAGLSNHGI
jgi:hypothetical protein